METETKTKVINATIYCVGIKARCRKVERHALDLGDFSHEKASSEEAIIMAASELVKSKMRSVDFRHRVIVRLSEHEITDYGNGVRVRSFQLYGGNERKLDITARLAEGAA